MKKRIALISGSNRGLGLETVRQLAELGHTVILTSRRMGAGQAARDKMYSLRDRIHFHILDVNKPESVNQVRDFVLKKFGRLDILINNAAINYDTWQNVVNANLNEVRQTLDTNLLGAWRLAQAFVPMMKKEGFGRIVNVSSEAGSIAGMGKGTPGYSVSKASLNILTMKFAAELKGSGILVNSVCPGWVRTEMGGADAPRDVSEGAKSIIWAATLGDDGPSGGFFRDGVEISF